MMTRAQWDALTPQQQWDQYLLLETEAEGCENELNTLRAVELPVVSDDTVIFTADGRVRSSGL
jgi:hypothetical protein